MAWLVVQSDFTGRLLTWDSHAYWSAVRGMEVVFALPLAGPVLAFILGGRAINDNVLLRFYVFHMLVLPSAFAMFLYLTFATLRRVGLSPAPEGRGAPGGREMTFRDHLFSMAILTALMFGVLATLAVLTPFRFGTEADPYSTPAGVRPPWYMLASYAVVEHGPGPAWLLGLILLIAAFAVLLLPSWSPRFGIEPASRRARIAGLAALALWALLSVLGAVLEHR
jgi:quinol-cytochrome oxidoreductase complex cytochrome b subunit